jgi:hypothetical protein
MLQVLSAYRTSNSLGLLQCHWDLVRVQVWKRVPRRLPSFYPLQLEDMCRDGQVQAPYFLQMSFRVCQSWSSQGLVQLQGRQGLRRCKPPLCDHPLGEKACYGSVQGTRLPQLLLVQTRLLYSSHVRRAFIPMLRRPQAHCQLTRSLPQGQRAALGPSLSEHRLRLRHARSSLVRESSRHTYIVYPYRKEERHYA